jgi:methionine-rich copper-binding protein CopC
LRTAELLAVVSVMSFLTQARAAGPTIVSVVPANGASGVAPSAPVVFTFSEAMDTTATVATFLDTNLATLSTTATWSTDQKTLTCTPSPPFPSPDEIIWSVTGQDTSGNPLQGNAAGIFIIGGSPIIPCDTVTHTNTEFVLEESWLYVQTSASPPALEPTIPYVVLAEVSLFSNLTASAASLTLPNSAVSNLADLLGDGQTFSISDFNTNEANLNASWPNGNYIFKTTGASLPAVTVAFNVAQPNAPQVSNFAAAQAVDSTEPFKLSWNAFSNRAGTNEIFVNIGYDQCAGTGFITNLPGTATSTTIPAGALLPASNYVNSTLGFISTTGTSSDSPKYTAGAVRSSVTSFTLTTIGGTGSGSLSFSNPVWSGGKLTFAITASPGKTITVQYSTTLEAGSWTTLLTTNSGSGTVTVTDTPSKTVPFHFYRAHE